jgi:hypothetical protein
MSGNVGRRDFLKKTMAAGGITAASFEEMALLAQAEEPKPPTPPAPAADFPKTMIGGVEISRVICGGNLISGYAHSRDLIYVSDLLRHYFSPEKIFETFRICEACGINSAMLKLDQATIKILDTYWKKEGGKIQWISQITNANDLAGEVQQSLDHGAIGVFTTGQMGDQLVRQGKIDQIAKTVDSVKLAGAIAGVSCHDLNVIISCEKAGIAPDFYMKTFNSKSYWSAGPKEQHDNVFFDEDPKKTIETMQNVERPWVAFKVLGAGALSPQEGFDYAVKNGADLLCVGMFDFQVEEDARIAKDVFAKYKQRPRPWRA